MRCPRGLKGQNFLESERTWFDDWDTSEPDGVIFKEVFTPEFISSIRESIQRSAQEFLRRNLLFPVRGLIRI